MNARQMVEVVRPVANEPLQLVAETIIDPQMTVLHFLATVWGDEAVEAESANSEELVVPSLTVMPTIEKRTQQVAAVEMERQDWFKSLDIGFMGLGGQAFLHMGCCAVGGGVTHMTSLFSGGGHLHMLANGQKVMHDAQHRSVSTSQVTQPASGRATAPKTSVPATKQTSILWGPSESVGLSGFFTAKPTLSLSRFVDRLLQVA